MLSRAEAAGREAVEPFAGSHRQTTKHSMRKLRALMASGVLMMFSAVAYSASSATYTYDALGRLTKVAYSDGVKTTTITYSYDAAGNRASVVSTAPA
jgi:hypothetical protein